MFFRPDRFRETEGSEDLHLNPSTPCDSAGSAVKERVMAYSGWAAAFLWCAHTLHLAVSEAKADTLYRFGSSVSALKPTCYSVTPVCSRFA